MSGVVAIQIEGRARATLAGLVAALARDKAAMGRRYGEWAVSAPTLESGVAAAAMAQDELGHARSTFPLLKQLLPDGYDDEDRLDVAPSLPLLSEPLASWETFVAVNLVVDGLLTGFVAAATDSAFTPLAQRARKILQEERSHHAHAAAWTRRLASDESRCDRLAEAVYDCWSQASGWPGDDDAYARLVSERLVAGSPAQLRSATQRTIASAVDGTKLAVLWR